MINITNIERFATHDGPGIRTVIFLKGCTLNCPWCANPENGNLKPTLFFSKEKCSTCYTCVNLCNRKALYFDEENFLNHDNDVCIRCNLCEENCLQNAISFSGKEHLISNIVEEIMKDKAYYEHSGGGITISGGEPFVQFENLKELLYACKAQQLHVAIETTGNYPKLKLQELMNDVDLFLYDFKHINDVLLEQITGGNGKLIKDNLEYLLSTNPEKVIVRIAVIPEFNDNEKDLCDMLDYLKSIGASRIDLLPYHSLGKSKYDKMKKHYSCPTRMMTKKHLEPYCKYAKKIGLDSRIGG